MASDWPPKKNEAFVFYLQLPAQAQDNTFVTDPTLALGDVRVSQDGGALTNLAPLPTVTPAGGKQGKGSLSAGEMTADQVSVEFSDVAGAQWKDMFIPFHTVARKLSDLAFAAMALTEGYAADGAAVTLEQALYELIQNIEERSVSGTTVTVKKRDGTTTAFTLTLSPDGTNPTGITRAT